MTSLAPAAPRIVLADRLLPRSIVVDVALVLAGTALTALLAQVAIPIWPVPITLQTFSVLLVGAVLGPFRGAASMGLYLVLGLVGVPVFTGWKSGNIINLPSGGYIVGFIIAAAVVGLLAQLKWDRVVLRTILSFVIGSAIIYAVGVPWLYVALAQSNAIPADQLLSYTITNGLLVFLIGDAVKAAAAGALLPATWKLVDRVKKPTQGDDAAA